MPATRIILFQDGKGDVPVLDWLNKLIKRDRKGYANCVARIEQLAEYGFELRRPAAVLNPTIHTYIEPEEETDE